MPIFQIKTMLLEIYSVPDPLLYMPLRILSFTELVQFVHPTCAGWKEKRLFVYESSD